MATSRVCLPIILLAVFLLGSVLPQVRAASSYTKQENTRLLDQFIDTLMSCIDLREVGLSMVEDGEVAYELGYLRSTKGAGRQRVNADTVFCLGGSTQAFTSVLLAMLLSAHENHTMDTPVHEIMPDSHFHLPGEFRTRRLNLKDILGMRSGLSNMDIVANAKGMSRDRLMQNLRFAPEVSQFREDNVYSEVLFSVAEEVARQLDGDSWENLLRQHVFEPLGMTSASFVHRDVWNRSHVAKPSLKYRQRYALVPWEAFGGQEVVAAATSVCASISDLSKWMNFILSGGKIHGNAQGSRQGYRQSARQLVSEEIIRSTFQSVQIRENGGNPRSAGFPRLAYSRVGNALGWIKGQYRGNNFLSQDGSLPGYESLSTLLPNRNIGVFTVFTGSSGSQAYAAKVLINKFALDVLMSNGSVAWSRASDPCSDVKDMAKMTEEADSAATSHHPRPPYATIDKVLIRPAEEYEGTYRNYAFGDVIVRYNDTDEKMTLEYGGLGRYELFQSVQNDTFLMQASEGPLHYTTHADEYRKRGSFLAIFSTAQDDPSLRVETVTIPHFARDMDPVFSKNPGPTPEDHHHDGDCSAASSVAASNAAPLLMALQCALYVLFSH